MLSDEEAERLRTVTVTALLALRREYLRTAACSRMKHWTQLRDRAVSAARRATTVDEWATMVMRGLQVPTLGVAGCEALVALRAAVRGVGSAELWLTMITDEHGLLFALARLAVEQDKMRANTAETQP